MLSIYRNNFNNYDSKHGDEVADLEAVPTMNLTIKIHFLRFDV